MKKNLVTILIIALVLALATVTLGGCFFQNLSILSGKLGTDGEAALDALNGKAENFSQLNVGYSKMSFPGQGDQIYNSTTEYKVTEKGIYYHYYAESIAPDGTLMTEDKEAYLEKDGDKYYLYKVFEDGSGKKEWGVVSTDKETFEDAMNTNTISEDTRANLFDPKNYKVSGDHYKYVGEEVYLVTDAGSTEIKNYFDVQGLYVEKDVFTIKAKYYPTSAGASMSEVKAAYSQPGMPIFTISYGVYNVGTTKISFPNVNKNVND